VVSLEGDGKQQWRCRNNYAMTSIKTERGNLKRLSTQEQHRELKSGLPVLASREKREERKLEGGRRFLRTSDRPRQNPTKSMALAIIGGLEVERPGAPAKSSRENRGGED